LEEIVTDLTLLHLQSAMAERILIKLKEEQVERSTKNRVNSIFVINIDNI
jgi:hypothetical protein